MKHIPTRYFTTAFGMHERWDFINKYADDCWEKAKKYNEQNKISKNAVAVAERIEKDLGIKLFPLITKIACKGFDIGGGTYAFSMTDINGQEYYFDSRAKYYTQKKRQIYLENDADVIGVD